MECLAAVQPDIGRDRREAQRGHTAGSVAPENRAVERLRASAQNSPNVRGGSGDTENRPALSRWTPSRAEYSHRLD